MAAGLGFKTFTTGEVLTAGDVNGYLMQGINVFTNATARDAAITAPAEGQFAFTKDNNSLWYYDGAAWVASGATGDIEGVTAGVGISGGGTSGTVTVTNSMATAIDAKGDLVPGTGADTFSRLAVGANGTVLTADSAEATGLKWATASGGGFTLIATATPSAASTFSFTSIPYASYKHLMIVANELVWSATGNAVKMRFATGSYYSSRVMFMTSAPLYSCDAGGRGDAYFGASQNEGCPIVKGYTSGGTFGDISSKSVIWIYDINNTSQDRLVEWTSFGQAIAAIGQGAYENSANLETIEFATTSGTVTGTVKLYGVS